MSDNYERYCKGMFKELKDEVSKLREETKNITSIVTNGLHDAVIRIENDLKEMKRNRNKWIIAIAGIVVPLLFSFQKSILINYIFLFLKHKFLCVQSYDY